MGGKKPIGEHPSRGHLQRRFTSTFRRGGHRHHGDGTTEEEDAVPVVQQEFSLFSQFDSTTNRFGILTTTEQKSNIVESPAMTHLPLEDKNEINVVSEIHSLHCNMSTLIAAFERLQYDFYNTANHAYMYSMQPHADLSSAMGYPSAPAESSSYPDPDHEAVVKRINERLSTLEGRQKSIQSKISQLDILYGSSTSSWSKSIKKILSEVSSGEHPNKDPPSPVQNGEKDRPSRESEPATAAESDTLMCGLKVNCESSGAHEEVGRHGSHGEFPCPGPAELSFTAHSYSDCDRKSNSEIVNSISNHSSSKTVEGEISTGRQGDPSHKKQPGKGNVSSDG
jgi:hypothetical protein